MSDVIEIAGNLILEEKKILLLYRKDEGHWDVPSGKVKENESPTETSVREAREEINVEVSLEKPFYSGEFQKDDDIFLWHCYQASIDGEPEIRGEDKFRELRWSEPSELDDLDLAPNIEMILPALRKL